MFFFFNFVFLILFSKVRSTKKLKIKVSDDSSHFFSFFFRNIMESTEEEKER